MKFRINVYLLRLLKENAIYIVVLVIFLLLLAYALPPYLKSYLERIDENTALEKEVETLNEQRLVITSIDPQELDEIIAVLEMILPTSEDYFSIFHTIEQLSKKSDIEVVSYGLTLGEGKEKKISVNVATKGTSSGYIDFLKKYKYLGGRLITIDRIEFNPRIDKMSFNLNLYSEEVVIPEDHPLTEIDYEQVEHVQTIAALLRNEGVVLEKKEEIQEIDYSTKSNPFVY